ncbi:hypothetical protein C2S51_026928 [Perilla frutescens var. frutescens]|nr:hypothetical protein C2S51_026928 [Perilla frutescens var. frutescens]
MASSKFMFFNTLLALAMLTDQLEGGGVLPTLHFIDTVSGKNPIKLRITAGGILRGSAELQSGGQDYEINVKIDEVYFFSAVFGLKFTAFHAYEPARDKNHDAVYWKADNDGFSLSYDKANWMNVASWESE